MIRRACGNAGSFHGLRMTTVREQTTAQPTALLLWDIDGTLLHCGRAGASAILDAMRNAFGVDASLDEIDFGGRTDIWIARQLFSQNRIEPVEENIRRFLATYVSLLPEALASHTLRVYPGAVTCLETLSADGRFAQAILTGNVRTGAEAKLRAARLGHFFRTGAYGCDAEDRNHLGPKALERARSAWGISFSPDRVCIIGDTPHDIACARAIGARCIAVAQGNYSLSELEAHSPDLAIADLSDPAPLLSKLQVLVS